MLCWAFISVPGKLPEKENWNIPWKSDVPESSGNEIEATTKRRWQSAATASYPDVSLSLDENVRAKEGGKVPSVPFPWSLAVHHQSVAFRARLYDAKNEAPEEEAGAAR